MRLVKRKGYAWPSANVQNRGGESYLDAVEVTYVPEESVRNGQFLQGQVDVLRPAGSSRRMAFAPRTAALKLVNNLSPAETPGDVLVQDQLRKVGIGFSIEPSLRKGRASKRRVSRDIGRHAWGDPDDVELC